MVNSQLGIDEAVRKINDYPFTQVRNQLVRGWSIPDDLIDQAIEEFRKFLILIAMGHEDLGMTSHDVDEVWHTFILYTRDYTAFCVDVFGRYIHHQPVDGKSDRLKVSVQKFLAAYEMAFGAVPSIWTDNLDDIGNGGLCSF